ncbi:fatty acid desaturase [Oculatella sp. LEGE 06141]|uniref:acyl-CoA desaturase n=1 Tax=Oculatella sp. LEGE 06141 TaxID=1828648 RepID=UPI001880CED3|nr:fatty acid desaturase [Oculatella sp. LEGE 06141]MBE9180088.1 fatty acid desaturase [Oculatella sp. LEGE 06141]
MIDVHSVSPRPRWTVIVFTIALHLAALLAFLPANFSWSAVGVAIVLYWLTMGLGISLGFHRLATHRSFKVPKWLEYFFILCGTLAAQGGVKGWVGYHRMHHLYADSPADPHNSTQGFWWSHISWLMHEVPTRSELRRFTKDIADDPFYRFCHKHYILLQVGLALALYGLGGMPFVVWGIFVRLFVCFHSTCFVNSVCHLLGYRTHNVDDRSTNCWWVALLTFGEGWHNNHHASQSSARFGWRWWELDLVWLTIRFLETVGLATHVKTASSLKSGG